MGDDYGDIETIDGTAAMRDVFRSVVTLLDIPPRDNAQDQRYGAPETQAVAQSNTEPATWKKKKTASKATEHVAPSSPHRNASRWTAPNEMGATDASRSSWKPARKIPRSAQPSSAAAGSPKWDARQDDGNRYRNKWDEGSWPQTTTKTGSGYKPVW